MNDTLAKLGFEIILVIFGVIMANLGPIDFKIGFYIKVNVNKR